MYVAHLKLENYKNLNLTVELPTGINLLVAPNGSGKSNFLEAINYFCDGISFRGASDEYIFPFGKDVELAAVEAEVRDRGGNVDLLRIVWQKGRPKQYFHNRKKTNLAKFKRIISCLVHAPQSLDVVSGSAGVRRDFLDKVIVLLRPGLRTTFTNYDRAVKQKNRLLKMYQLEKVGFEELSRQKLFWDKLIVENAGIITQERITLLNLIAPVMSEMAGEIYSVKDYALDFQVSSKYFSESDYEGNSRQFLHKVQTSLAQKLHQSADKEIGAAKVLYGAHRDDYEFLLNTHSVRYTASRGQQRLFSLILHLAVFELIQAEYGQQIILLLDDIFSELDPNHRQNTLDYLHKAHKQGKILQIFITSPDSRDLGNKKQKSVHNLELF
jgi:DNA replication and repair protein RecF